MGSQFKVKELSEVDWEQMIYWHYLTVSRLRGCATITDGWAETRRSQQLPNDSLSLSKGCCNCSHGQFYQFSYKQQQWCLWRILPDLWRSAAMHTAMQTLWRIWAWIMQKEGAESNKDSPSSFKTLKPRSVHLRPTRTCRRNHSWPKKVFCESAA